VASTEKVLISNSGVQLLYNGQALKENLTTDGVHLNEDGKKIYREALLKILKEF
jgi:lysophospholipase L1-like esterase